MEYLKIKLTCEDRKVLFNNTDFVIFPRENINYTSNKPFKPNANKHCTFY